METIFGFNTALFFILVVWSAVWKGISLWKSGRNNQLAWFILLFIINTVGILEIIYLAFFQKPKPEARVQISVEQKALKRPAKKKK